MNKGRKISGGKYHANKKKKLYERRGQERRVILGDQKTKQMRIKGGNSKSVLLKANFANISMEGKIRRAEIKNVAETPSNKFFARQNRLMKGAIIETSLGRARISNRPSQEGCVNAVLLQQK